MMMNRPKTPEEFVLNEYYKQLDEIQLLYKKIEELEEKLKSPTDNAQCIYISDTPYYWYSVDLKSEYSWNEILVKNGKTPEFVEKALSDSKFLEELCSLRDGNSYFNECIGEVKERVYNYLFKGRNGKYGVIVTREDNTDFFQIGDKHHTFLSREEAEDFLKCQMIKNINYYIERCKDKYPDVYKRINGKSDEDE